MVKPIESFYRKDQREHPLIDLARMLLFYFLQDGTYVCDIFRLEPDAPLAHDEDQRSDVV